MENMLELATARRMARIKAIENLKVRAATGDEEAAAKLSEACPPGHHELWQGEVTSTSPSKDE